MRFRKTQSLLVVFLLVILCSATLLAIRFDCDDCSIPETIECRGVDQWCMGFDVLDCSGCDFRCAAVDEGEWFYGELHECEEVPPI